LDTEKIEKRIGIFLKRRKRYKELIDKANKELSVVDNKIIRLYKELSIKSFSFNGHVYRMQTNVRETWLVKELEQYLSTILSTKQIRKIIQEETVISVNENEMSNLISKGKIKPDSLRKFVSRNTGKSFIREYKEKSNG